MQSTQRTVNGGLADRRRRPCDSACRCGSMLVVSLYRGCVSSGGELSDGRRADGRNRPTSHGRSRVELMWRWTTTRGGIFWRVVSPRGSRHLPCLFPYLLPLGFTCQGNPPAIRSLPQRIHRVAKGSTDRCVVAGYVCYDAQSYPTGPHHSDSWIHGLDFGRTSLSTGRSFPSSTQRWWPRALASLARFIMAMPNFSLW